jgi:putative hydroxymethylpyrimidine transport system substrate-binding protein
MRSPDATRQSPKVSWFFFSRKNILSSLILFASLHQAAAADHLTVLLDWFINPDHAPILVAQQIGAYAAENLDVTLIPPADATMPPKLVAAGDGDIALTAEPQFLEQVSAGLPLFRIGALIDKPLSTLVALQSSGITKLADLRGKRIGYGSGEVERAMVGAMLHTAGLSLDDVHMVQIGEQLTVALLAHQVDAVTVYRNFETIELAQHGAKTIGFNYEQYGVPTFDELILVSRAIKPGDTRFVRFLRATEKGAAFLLAHPAESWKAFAAAHPDLNDALNHQAWFATLPYFTADPFGVDPGEYTTFAKFLQKAGVIDSAPRAIIELRK